MGRAAANTLSQHRIGCSSDPIWIILDYAVICLGDAAMDRELSWDYAYQVTLRQFGKDGVGNAKHRYAVGVRDERPRSLPQPGS